MSEVVVTAKMPMIMNPKWLTEVYDTNLMRSLEVTAIVAPQSTEMTASTRTNGVAHCEACGNRPRQMRIIPRVPILSSRPTSRVEAPGVACSAASGSQVCTGTIGALIAKAMKKATKRNLPIDPSKSTFTSSPRRKLLPCTPTPMTPKSMTRPPARE